MIEEKLLGYTVVVSETVPDNKILFLSENVDKAYMNSKQFTKLVFKVYENDFDMAIKVLADRILTKLFSNIEYTFNVVYARYVRFNVKHILGDVTV